MKPNIDSTHFGSITIDRTPYDHDVVIRMNGEVIKRKKKLSKAIYGTSHVISLDEAKFVYEDGAEKLIVGTGQSGQVKLSEEAASFFSKKHLPVILMPTPRAITEWNKAIGSNIGLFHVTC